MRKSVFLVALLSVAVAPLVASSQKSLCNSVKRKSAIGNVHLILKIDRTSYPLDQLMDVDVVIRNDGRDPVYVYSETWWGYAGGWALEFFDSNKKLVGPGFGDEEVMPPPRDINDPAVFVPLHQDNVFGVHRAIRVKPFLRTPGKYTLAVVYRNPLSCSIVGPRLQALPALWLEDRSIVSNSVSFEVVP